MPAALREFLQNALWDFISGWFKRHGLEAYQVVPALIIGGVAIYSAGWLSARSSRRTLSRKSTELKRWILARSSIERGTPQLRINVVVSQGLPNVTKFFLVNDGDKAAYQIRA